MWRTGGGGSHLPNSLLIGLRTYLTGDNEDELILQLKEARQFFPDSFILVELCGKDAGAAAYETADMVDHYSKKPLGLTPPFQKIIDFAKDKGFPSCILIDGDSQHKFSEVSRIFETTDDALVPTRVNRSLFLNDAPDLDRITLEEAENAFLRIAEGCFVPDPQPGLAILKTKSAVQAIELAGISSMIADLVVTTQVFLAGLSINSPEITIRPQKFTRVNTALEFRKVSELEEYYCLSFEDVIERIKKEPELLLPRGNPSSLESLLTVYRSLH